MARGSFVISLDFEIGWGLVDHSKEYILAYKESNTKNAVIALGRIRETLKKYNMKLTVCYVGAIGLKDFDDFIMKAPASPSYTRHGLSPQQMLEDLKELKEQPELFFQPDVIRSLAEDDMIELGTHTFIHYFCAEPGQTLNEFENDIKTAVVNAPKPLKSIIFPRNQVEQCYLSICKKYGFTHYRGMRENALWKIGPKKKGYSLRRALRLIDTYIPLIGSNSYNVVDNECLRDIPGSAFLRPYSKKLHFLEGLKTWRICWSMKRAARKGEVYHLWWHPHNFGANMDRNIEELEKICKCYVKLNKKYAMESRFMSEL